MHASFLIQKALFPFVQNQLTSIPLQNNAFQIHYSNKKSQTTKSFEIFWWGKVDSNHRSRRQQIYSLPHLTALEFPHIQFGAGGRIRTPDLLITNQLLYQLSYTSGLHDQQQGLY